MKKNQKRIFMETDQNPMIRIKHQTLLQDYGELHNGTEAMKEKLLIAKQKKLALLAEVRFLKCRYEFLKPKHSLKQPQNFEIRTMNTGVKKGKSYRKKEASSKSLAFRKSRPPFQRARICSEKEVTLHDSFPIYDQKEIAYREQEAAVNRNTTPVFDLNQILREEEELQASFEPLRMEESKKSLLRSGNDAKNSVLKMSMCRNVGNGANRAGKRKISWQDQVALRA